MKKYHVVYSERALKELKRMDKYTRQMIYSWIDKHLEGCENLRQFGKGLTANRSGQWRYRIGDYRLICEISDGKLVILALAVGHRREILSGNN